MPKGSHVDPEQVHEDAAHLGGLRDVYLLMVDERLGPKKGLKTRILVGFWPDFGRILAGF